MTYASLAEVRAAMTLGSEGDWSDPDWSILENGLGTAPAFPVDCMGALAGWISDFARTASAPVDYAAAGVLAAASACIGATRMVSPWPGWSEYLALWVLMVGAPSASKSPVFAPLASILKAIERDEGADFGETRRAFETTKRAAHEERAKWETEVARAIRASGVAPLKPERADDPEEPKPPRIVVADATIESLAPLFKANRRGLLLARDELAAWIGSFGKYGGDGDAAFFLERFTGAPVTVDRVKAGHTTAPCGLLSVFGGIQPERLTELLLKRPDDGFVSRFLMAYPDPVPRARPTHAVDMAILVGALRRLRALPFDADAEGEPAPRTVRLTPAASAAFEQWWRENGEAGASASGFEAGSLGKGPGIVLRLALILELLEWAIAPEGPEPEHIGEVAILAACALFNDYFTPMAARVFGGVGRSVAEIAGAALLRHIRHEGERTVNARALQRAKLPGLRSADRMHDALDALSEGGWARFLGGREGAATGRQRGDWEINPALWEARP
jgi:Protein of unknown function (DUF3987)